jgi:phage/plasmid primase-like uncharacterized protein
MSGHASTFARARDIDLLACALKYVELKRIGRMHEYEGPCPPCGGTDRFRLNPHKRTFPCRQCGGKGKGAIDLVMLAEGCDFRRAVEILDGVPLEAATDRAGEQRAFAPPGARPQPRVSSEDRFRVAPHRRNARRALSTRCPRDRLRRHRRRARRALRHRLASFGLLRSTQSREALPRI